MGLGLELRVRVRVRVRVSWWGASILVDDWKRPSSILLRIPLRLPPPPPPPPPPALAAPPAP